MGPTLIFDKSLLQSLNMDESMWLDNFFISNITPLFYIETLADLEKEIKNGRTPEEIVGNLADKTPDYSSAPNVHHASLLTGELSGAGTIDMRYGRTIISEGRPVEINGEIGIIYDQSPEAEVLERWRNSDFLEIERLYARAWREALSIINLEDKYILFQRYFTSGKPKDLAEIKKLTDSIIDDPKQGEIFSFGMWLLGIPELLHKEVITRWEKTGKPPIRQFAPYFTFVLSVDLFFYLGIAADLIGRGRASHKIDIAYLYYLPFCMVFTSSDKLHAQVAPFFLNKQQSFILGQDLKAGLGALDRHYAALPDETKKRGVSSFAVSPPTTGSFLISEIWDKHMSPKWRERTVNLAPQPKTEASEALIKKLRQIEAEGKPLNPTTPIDSDKVGHLLIKRSVRARKGKWDRFPPEVMNRHKNKKGEWEDNQ